jgi:raffinose/stachyose/melibiose transport system permease protein
LTPTSTGWLMVAEALSLLTRIWDGVAATGVGLNHYLTFLTDPVLQSAFSHVLVLICFFSLLPIALGLRPLP